MNVSDIASFKMRLQARSVLLVAILFSGLVIFLSTELWTIISSEGETSSPVSDYHNHAIDKNPDNIRLKRGKLLPKKRDSNCLMHSCFDVFRCGINENKLIAVYVYPYNHFIDENGAVVNKPMSQEFHDLLSAIMRSKYYTSDMNSACILIPSIDTLNQNGLDLNGSARILASLPGYVKLNLCFIRYHVR